MTFEKYLEILPIKKYVFSLVKKNKHIILKLIDENGKLYRLKYIHKNLKDNTFSKLIYCGDVNDFRKNLTLVRDVKITVDKHDAIKLIFLYEDW